MSPTAIALGSNLGNRRAHLERAVEALTRLLDSPLVSRIIETDPVGVPDEQPPYLNAAMIGHTTLPPRDLLTHLQAMEAAAGRTRPAFRAARTLDLDIVLYGQEIIDAGDLVIPHPRFRERSFVLEPLAEIAPEWRDPVTGRTMRELCVAIRPSGRP
jgi:2-amino-4-hydroxy-6-hydroxymethyldihydropteridine diphosphokinase